MTEVADNPFDPNSSSSGSQTLGQLIQTGAANAARELRVCMPASIVRVRGNQLVDVQPSLLASYAAAASPQPLPVVPNVPVSMPMGSSWSIKMPVAVGDLGMLLFADKALDTWLAGSGKLVDPGDPRSHDITDAIFVPGLYPPAKNTTDATTDLVFSNGAASVRIEAAGHVRIGTQAADLTDLAKQLSDLAGQMATALAATTVATATGPAPLSSSAQLLQYASSLQTISASLATLKG